MAYRAKGDYRAGEWGGEHMKYHACISTVLHRGCALGEEEVLPTWVCVLSRKAGIVLMCPCLHQDIGNPVQLQKRRCSHRHAVQQQGEKDCPYKPVARGPIGVTAVLQPLEYVPPRSLEVGQP